MQTAHVIVSAVIAMALIAGTIYGAWRRLITRPDSQPPHHGAPRHARPHDSAAERIPSRAELDAWREDWTAAELDALHGYPRTPLTPDPPWSFSRWEIEQAQWLQARRRESHEQQLILREQLWSDPWWTRR
jgi:hypothetical protein